MAEETCEPVASPCKNRGLAWYDWAYSIFTRICQGLSWLGGIYNNTRIAPYGKLAVLPAHATVNAGAQQTVTVPSGAIAIQAYIDNDYASTYRLTIQPSGLSTYQLPAGTDFSLPVVTPLYVADVNGGAAQQGYGYYPGYTFTFPAGARGFVTAIYRGVQQTLTVA